MGIDQYRAVSSEAEHSTADREVTGSIPVQPFFILIIIIGLYIGIINYFTYLFIGTQFNSFPTPFSSQSLDLPARVLSELSHYSMYYILNSNYS